jgi:hypothetical protein
MSADSVTTDDGLAYPVEYLNSLNVSGLPLAKLALKPGCPLMLLRNIDPTNGLCNGTHMILLRIKSRVLECRILGGDGKTVFIPRIGISPSSEDLHIPLMRRQFPVHLAFAMTIKGSLFRMLVLISQPLSSHMVNFMLLFLDALLQIGSRCYFLKRKRGQTHQTLYTLRFWLELHNLYMYFCT